MKANLPIVLALLAGPAFAAETRQLDAHEHGHGELNIAFDGPQVAIELRAPGADIVGFEHEATNAADRAAIDAAVATLARPLELFVLPAAAECSVTQASAELESAHDHEGEHAESHDGGDGHAGEETHSEFHAEYLLTCGNPEALSEITFAYFDSFPNALELEVQVVSPTGANAFDVDRDDPVLDLRGVTGA